VTNTVLRLPFTVRWQNQLDAALREGGWHVHSAGSQHGKTTGSMDYRNQHRVRNAATGSAATPAGLAWAADSKPMILRSLATDLGGQHFARLPHLELKLPPLMQKLGTRLVIVNNGHNLEWRQWQELLTLDDICAGEYGIRLTVVLSGVHKQLGLIKVPQQAELIEQITNRIRCYREIEGHGPAEVREALQLIVEDQAPQRLPQLLKKGLLTQSNLVFQFLTRPEIDLAGRKTVASVHLIELSRRILALHKSDPGASAEQLVRAAFANYIRYRRPAKSTSSTSAAVVQAVTASGRRNTTPAPATVTPIAVSASATQSAGQAA
jgi:hypothetical protein